MKMNNELKEFHRICSKYLVRDGLTNCYYTPAYDNYLGNRCVAVWSKLNGIRIGTFRKFGNEYFEENTQYHIDFDYYDDFEFIEKLIIELVDFVKKESVKIKKRNLEKDFV